MLMILARLVRSESFWAVVKVAPRTTARKYGTLDVYRPRVPCSCVMKHDR